MGYRWLATLILVVHFGYLAFLVTGGFLAWRWPRLIWWHGAAAAWAVLVVAAQLIGPLTYAEDWARRRAGGPGLDAGFIDRYLEGVIYPERYAALMQALVAMMVLGSWVGFAARGRRRLAHR